MRRKILSSIHLIFFITINFGPNPWVIRFLDFVNKWKENNPSSIKFRKKNRKFIFKISKIKKANSKNYNYGPHVCFHLFTYFVIWIFIMDVQLHQSRAYSYDTITSKINFLLLLINTWEIKYFPINSTIYTKIIKNRR